MVKVYCERCGKLVFEAKGTKSVFGNYVCSTCGTKESNMRKLKEKQQKAKM